MKRKNIIIGIVAIVLALIGVVLTRFLVSEPEIKKDKGQSSANEATRVFTYSESDVMAVNDFYQHDIKNINVALDGHTAYSMDYNAEIPCANGEKLGKQDGLSGTVTTALLFGYPIFSPEEMGLESKEEAIMATQFAVWRLSQAEGVDEAKSYEYIFEMDNLRAKEEYEESLERIKAAAEALIDIALKVPYYDNPLLSVNDEESKIRLCDEQIIVGPYNIKATGYIVKDIQVSLIDEPESANLCDIKGNVKNNFVKGEDIYIKLDNSLGELTFTLRVDTKGSHSAGVVYGTGIVDDNKQNICIVETFEDKLDAFMDISIPEISTGDTESDVTGFLKVISVDETKERLLAGITYEILNEDGIVIETLVSDENGEILSQELSEGTYYFREVAGPNDIHIDSTRYKFEIMNNEVIEVYTLLHYYAKGKLSILFRDEGGNPVEGIEIQILDEEHNLVDTIHSDAMGEAKSKYLLVGKYFYKQASVPDGIVIDSTEYDFALAESLQLLRVEIECEKDK